MDIIYKVLFIYGIAFAIGMFVALIIWILNKTINGDKFQRIIHRELYHEMKRLKTKEK
jgi:hypothetical protein